MACMALHCAGEDDDIRAVYKICQSIEDAKPMTHKTITATQINSIDPSVPILTPTVSIMSPSSSLVRTLRTRRSTSSFTAATSSATSQSTLISTFTQKESSAATRSSKIPSFLPSSSSSLPSTTSNSATTTSSPTATTTTSSTSTAIAAAAAANAAKPVLTKPQIAGIAIGGVACAAITLGLLFFIFCLRRRRTDNRLSGSSFGNDKVISSNPVSPGFFPPRNEALERAQSVSPGFLPSRNGDAERAHSMRDVARIERQYGFVTPERNNASETAFGRNSLHPEEIGLAVGSETMERLVDETPPSAASYRTTSKLLPDKPTYSLYPSPLRIKNPRSPVSPISGHLQGEAGIGQKGLMPLSRPSPRLGNSSDTSPLQPQQGFSPLHASVSDPFLDHRSAPRALTYSSPRRQALRLETPSTNRPQPETFSNGPWTQSLDNLRKPVAARHSSSARELNRQKAAFASISPSDYAGRSLFQPLTDRPSPLRHEGRGRKRSNEPQPAAVRYSSASETNFEDTDDEGVPPMPTFHPFLSPFQSSGDVSSSKPPGSVTSQQPNPRPPAASPTPKTGRRKQPEHAPLSTPNVAGRNGMQKRKALPGVPEIPDNPLIPTGRGRHEQVSVTPRERERITGDVRNTAKWQILVSPGLRSIENADTSRSLGSEWRPATPPKPGGARRPSTPTRRYGQQS